LIGLHYIGLRVCLPEPELKFNAALPKHLAGRTLAARLADLDGAAKVLTEPLRIVALEK
jgi:ATP-dependent Lhr-like helicase